MNTKTILLIALAAAAAWFLFRPRWIKRDDLGGLEVSPDLDKWLNENPR